jgi:hypothetical protein
MVMVGFAFFFEPIDFPHGLELFRSEVRQVSDEHHQFPVLFVLSAPPGHTRKSDAILDDVEDLTVPKILRSRLPEVGWRWIKTGPDLGFPTSVVSVAYSTVVGEMVSSFGNVFGRLRKRVS